MNQDFGPVPPSEREQVIAALRAFEPTAPATGSACPVCKFQGEPECDETWNGIRGPGARVIARRWNCPKCGVVFAHPDGWQNAESSGGAKTL